MATTTKTKSAKSTKLRPVLVTTANTSVTDGETIKLKDARNCLYWSRACGGFRYRHSQASRNQQMNPTQRIAFDFASGPTGSVITSCTFEVTRSPHPNGDEYTADLISGDFRHGDDYGDARDMAIEEAKKIWAEADLAGKRVA